MMLIGLIVSVLVGGLLAWLSVRLGRDWPRWVSLATLGGHLIALIYLWVRYLYVSSPPESPWMAEVDLPWIPQLGIRCQLALDGLSLLLVILTNFLGIMAVIASWKEITTHLGFFHFNLLWILAAVMGVFMAVDLMLFYVFWELMLVPLYLLVAIWGHEHKVHAAVKLFLFTQAGSLLMLLAILGLYFVHGRNAGVYSFDYRQLMATPMSDPLAFWLMLGFFAAFAVKLPVVPLHSWLADAHTQAPTAGSVGLAGLVLKVGAYGLLRFLVPLFPQAALQMAPVAMWLGVAGIFYGALVALGQNDLKRLVAYTSISHMGFVLLGIFAWNQLALQGAVMIMIAHGVSTGALFILVGDLNHRMGTRSMDRMGGLWATMPRMGSSALVLALASLGLPGLANFVGEFLVLLGTYQVNRAAAVAACGGFVVSTVYALWMMQQVFFGPNRHGWKLPDTSPRETALLATMIGVVVWLGVYPQPVLHTSEHAVSILQQHASRRSEPSGLQPTAANRPTDGVEKAVGFVQTGGHAE